MIAIHSGLLLATMAEKMTGPFYSGSNPDYKEWGPHQRVGGEARVSASPNKKIKRKMKQASRRRNR